MAGRLSDHRVVSLARSSVPRSPERVSSSGGTYGGPPLVCLCAEDAAWSSEEHRRLSGKASMVGFITPDEKSEALLGVFPVRRWRRARVKAEEPMVGPKNPWCSALASGQLGLQHTVERGDASWAVEGCLRPVQKP